MSLDIARSIAVSSLMATQVQISVASANIANAGTAGYTEKTATQEATNGGGVGTGTMITAITGNVDQLLLKSLVAATSELGSANTSNDYLNQLQALYGSTTGANNNGTSLANTLASLESAISSLSGSTGSAALQANVVTSLDDVAAQLRDTSSGIQTLRGNADSAVSSAVDDVNTQLKTIASFNSEIKLATASGQPTGDLEDQRNSALEDIASKMNVSYFISSSGDMQVYTASGQALVDSTVHPLSFTAASSVTADTVYDPGTIGSLSGISANGVDVTSQVGTGEIGALINLRDSVLPAAQTQLDQLARQLKAALNAVSNAGAAVPPPASLTGTTAVTAGTALSATGTVRIAVADKSGNLVSYGDINLSTIADVGDLVTAINGIPGLNASIDSSGHVVIASTSGSNGVAINEMTSAVGSTKVGLSDYLGLNDLVTGTGASNIAARGDILDDSGKLPVSTLSSAATLTVGSSVLSAGSATMVNALYTALTGATAFAAAGGLGSSTGSFTDYAASIVADVASKASAASTTYTSKQTTLSTFSSAMSSQSGVNLDEETSQISTLQNQYTAASQLIQSINQMFTALITAVQTTG